MYISYFIIAIIFIYAIYTLVSFAQKTKKGGACVHCSLKNNCPSQKCAIPIQPIIENKHSIKK